MILTSGGFGLGWLPDAHPAAFVLHLLSSPVGESSSWAKRKNSKKKDIGGPIVITGKTGSK